MRDWQVRTLWGLFFLFCIGVCLFSRLYGLDFKPIHHDESVGMWWVMEIWNKGFFKYDPTNYHGPLLYYMFQIGEIFGGDDLWTYRFITSMCNVVLFVFLLQWAWRGKKEWLWVPFAMLASPAMVFFTRSALHESPFVAFQVLAMVGVIEFARYSRVKGIIYFLWGLCGAMLLKETFAIPVLAGILILPFAWSTLRRPYSKEEKRVFWLHLSLTVGVWALIYSGFTADGPGLVGFFKAFMPWTQTGVGGAGHQKAWSYWLELVFKYEPVVLICMVLTFAGLFLKDRLAMALGIFAIIQFAIYSAIPYKTPWCIISMIWPFYFSSARAVSVFATNFVKSKLVVASLYVAGAILSVWQFVAMTPLVFQKPIERNHDYVYVQTSESAQRAFDYIDKAAEQDPTLKSKLTLVVSSDPWPFPAVLRKFHRVLTLGTASDSYFSQLSAKPGILITYADAQFQQELLQKLGLEKSLQCEEKFSADYGPCQFAVRDGMRPMEVLITKERSE